MADDDLEAGDFRSADPERARETGTVPGWRALCGLARGVGRRTRLMAAWATFVAEAANMAAVADQLWPGITSLARDGEPRMDDEVFAIAYLATVRPDGGPRLHPFCPILADGRLFAAVPKSSPKGNDLRRDPRCVIHAVPGPDDAELCIRAQAHEVTDAATRAAVVAVVAASGVGGMAVTAAHDPLFEFDLERVDTARWVDVGQPGTYAERRRWVA